MQLCSFCARKWIDRYALIKGHVEKNLERLCTSVRARQNLSGTSLGQTSKQLHAGAIKPEPGLCGSGFWFFQSIRFPLHVGSEDEIVEEKNLYSLPCIVTRTRLFFNLPEERWRDVFTRQTNWQWISFSHALIGCSNSGYAVKFTSMRPQTRVSYEQNGFPVYCRNKRRNLTKKLKKLFPEKHEKGDELWFVRVKICLFNWNLSMKSVKKFFVSKRKLSLTLLYLADILINKPKTKLNVFNYVVCFFFDGRKTCTASSQAFSVIAFRWNIRRRTARRLARTTWPETHRPARNNET